MTTFAFVALCLILFAIAGSFAILWLKEKIDTRINRSERTTDESLEEHRTCLADLIADVSEIKESVKVLETALQQVQGNPQSRNAPGTLPLRGLLGRTEERYIREAQEGKKDVRILGVSQSNEAA